MLPILYQSHNFILYSYPLLMGLGWGIGYQIFFSKLDPKVSKFKAQFIFWGLFLSAWIGAKTLFSLTYPDTFPDGYFYNLSFWTGGGFVFYGGFLGALVFLLLFRLVEKKLKMMDLWPLVPALALGHGIGRVGCFLAGCCYGKPTDFFWGIFLHDHYRHPTQLIEALGLLILGMYLYRSKNDRVLLLVHYCLGYGLLRFGVETLRGDEIRGEWGILTPSQWISLFLVGAGVLGLILRYFKRLKSSKQ